MYLIKWGEIPELPRKGLSAFCEIFVWNSQVFMLLIKIEKKILLFYSGMRDQNRRKKSRLMIVYFNAVHKVHIIQATYFLKRTKAVLIFLDPSPGRKPSVMKYLWKGYFVVSDFLLLFWIPFQEKLNWFSSPGLLCYSPFHLCFFGVKTWCRYRIPLPGLTSLHESLKQKQLGLCQFM